MTSKKNLYLIPIFALVAGLSAIGCGARQRPAGNDLEARLQQQKEQINSLESRLDTKNTEVSSLQNQLDTTGRDLEKAEAEAKLAEQKAREDAKKSRTASVSRTAPEVELLPPAARAGECYARVFVPPTYETYTESVLKREASERIELMPARYEWVEEKVLVKESSEKIEIVPATFERVEEKVMVKPASKQIEEIPAQFETVTEKILVEPAHTVWKKGRGPVEKIDEATGEIMCLVEVPDRYRTVTKKVLKSKATTRVVELPAQYETVKKQVVKSPATVRKVQIPAEYETVKIRKLVSPPQEKRIPIPAEQQTVSRTRQLADGRMEWRPVLCETNMTPELVTSLQKALRDSGHSPGPIDGIIGSRTMAAVQSFQRSKGFATGNLTVETLRELDLEPVTAPVVAERREKRR